MDTTQKQEYLQFLPYYDLFLHRARQRFSTDEQGRFTVPHGRLDSAYLGTLISPGREPTMLRFESSSDSQNVHVTRVKKAHNTTTITVRDEDGRPVSDGTIWPCTLDEAITVPDPEVLPVRTDLSGRAAWRHVVMDMYRGYAELDNPSQRLFYLETRDCFGHIVAGDSKDGQTSILEPPQKLMLRFRLAGGQSWDEGTIPVTVSGSRFVGPKPKQPGGNPDEFKEHVPFAVTKHCPVRRDGDEYEVDVRHWVGDVLSVAFGEHSVTFFPEPEDEVVSFDVPKGFTDEKTENDNWFIATPSNSVEVQIPFVASRPGLLSQIDGRFFLEGYVSRGEFGATLTFCLTSFDNNVTDDSLSASLTVRLPLDSTVIFYPQYGAGARVRPVYNGPDWKMEEVEITSSAAHIPLPTFEVLRETPVRARVIPPAEWVKDVVLFDEGELYRRNCFGEYDEVSSANVDGNELLVKTVGSDNVLVLTSSERLLVRPVPPRFLREVDEGHVPEEPWLIEWAEQPPTVIQAITPDEKLLLIDSVYVDLFGEHTESTWTNWGVYGDVKFDSDRSGKVRAQIDLSRPTVWANVVPDSDEYFPKRVELRVGEVNTVVLEPRVPAIPGRN